MDRQGEVCMSTIAFFEIEDWEQEYIKRLLPDHTLYFTKKKMQDIHDDARYIKPY